MIQNKQAIYLLTLAHYKERLAKQNKNYSHIGNCKEEELPQKPVGQQTTDSWLTGFFWGALLHNYQGK